MNWMFSNPTIHGCICSDRKAEKGPKSSCRTAPITSIDLSSIH